MTLNRLKEAILFFSLIALCFDAYAFFYVATFPVTLSFCCVAAILFVGFFEVLENRKPLNSRQTLICLALVLLIVLEVMLSARGDISSASLYIFYVLAFSVSGYQISSNRFHKKLKTVMIFYTVLSVYGIYQFIAYSLDLPFKEFLIEGFMVKGFNRTNLVYIAGHTFQRAHSIYLEPSYLSQFAAVAIVLAYILYTKKFIKLKTCIAVFVINLTVSVLSIAGTGFLMLGILFICFCVDYVIRHGFNKNVAFGLVVILLGVMFVFCVDTTITSYIRTRIYEVVNPKYSGGMRFSYPYLIMFDTWSSRIFGYTPGNEYSAILNYFDKKGIPATFYTMASGYAKIGVELGLPGLILLFCLMFSVNRKGVGGKYIFIFALCINFVGGNLLQNYFWIFIMLLNVKFTSGEECGSTSRAKSKRCIPQTSVSG